MRWTEWLMCWIKPSHWRDHHPFEAEERAEAKPIDGPDRPFTKMPSEQRATTARMTFPASSACTG
jgi:hypothetical protein